MLLFLQAPRKIRLKNTRRLGNRQSDSGLDRMMPALKQAPSQTGQQRATSCVDQIASQRFTSTRIIEAEGNLDIFDEWSGQRVVAEAMTKTKVFLAKVVAGMNMRTRKSKVDI